MTATSPPTTRIDIIRYKEITNGSDLVRMSAGQPVILYQNQRMLIGLLGQLPIKTDSKEFTRAIVRRVEDAFVEYTIAKRNGEISLAEERTIRAGESDYARYQDMYQEARALRQTMEAQR